MTMTYEPFTPAGSDEQRRYDGRRRAGERPADGGGRWNEPAADPWGEPGYPNIAEEYGRHVTPDQRSHRRALDGFHDYPQVVDLANRLLTHGFSDDDVRGILGENYLRLFAQVWNPASALAE